jgi:hypothetical protein
MSQQRLRAMRYARSVLLNSAIAAVLLAISTMFTSWALDGIRRGHILLEGLTADRAKEPQLYWSMIASCILLALLTFSAGVMAALDTFKA